MMKKIVSILLCAALLACALSFNGCADKKKKLESSKEDLTVIGSVDGHDVPLEIYRYVALNTRADYENGDGSVWIGEDGAALLEELNKAVDDTVLNLYTTVIISEDYGISADDSYITDALEMKMDALYSTYGYDWDAYLDDLSANHMNDSVCRFIMRNDILAEELLAKMIERGEIPAYSEDFAGIARSDEFVRVKQLLISSTNGKTDEENYAAIKTLKARLDKGQDFEDLIGEAGEDIYMFSNNNGYYISRGSFLEEFEDAAFSLAVGETSDIVKTPAGYCILKCYEKEEKFIKANLADLYSTYCDGKYNLILTEKKNTLSLSWNDKAEKYTIFTLGK